MSRDQQDQELWKEELQGDNGKDVSIPVQRASTGEKKGLYQRSNPFKSGENGRKTPTELKFES